MAQKPQFEGKRLSQWSVADTVAWASSLGFNDSIRQSLVAKLTAYAVNGEFLQTLDKQDLRDEFGLDQVVAPRFVRYIEEASKQFRGLGTGSTAVQVSTTLPDCITMEEQGAARAVMPCGHAIGQPTMLRYLQSEFESPATVDLRCPVPECKQQWPWGLCCTVANLDGDELAKYDRIRFTRRHHTDMKCCPYGGCGVALERPQSLNELRMHCPACCNPDFCWHCLQPWQGTGRSMCSRPGCTTDHINMILGSCSTKTINGLPWAVYSIRACPNCHQLIEHETACKHMKCNNCKTDFCFACLVVKPQGGSWPCPSVCSLAGRQRF